MPPRQRASQQRRPRALPKPPGSPESSSLTDGCCWRAARGGLVLHTGGGAGDDFGGNVPARPGRRLAALPALAPAVLRRRLIRPLQCDCQTVNRRAAARGGRRAAVPATPPSLSASVSWPVISTRGARWSRRERALADLAVLCWKQQRSIVQHRRRARRRRRRNSISDAVVGEEWPCSHASDYCPWRLQWHHPESSRRRGRSKQLDLTEGRPAACRCCGPGGRLATPLWRSSGLAVVVTAGREA